MRVRLLEQIRQDLQHGWRILAKNPGFTSVAVLTLALGIGANTAIFSVVNAVLLHPLPVRDPQRVVVLHDQFPTLNLLRTTVSPLQFRQFSQRRDLFEASAALKPVDINLTGRDQPLRLQAMRTTSDLFGLLGIEPIFGRAFTSEDERGAGGHVVILSHGLSLRLFGNDPSAVGKRLQLEGASYEIVGVLPEKLAVLYPHTDLWLPFEWSSDSLSEKYRWYVGSTMLARLRRGVSIEQARAGMETEAASFNRGTFEGFGVEVRPLLEETIGDVRAPLYLLFGCVGIVLLIACANLANLLLARNGTRSREIAVRASLGATRGRLLLQLLSESLLLSIIGGALGLLLAQLALVALLRMAPADIPRVNMIRLDPGALLFTIVLSVLAGIIFGAAPAWMSARPDLIEALKGGGPSSGRHSGRERLRRGLAMLEVAFTLMLLIAFGLLARSFAKMLDVRPGFDPGNVMTMRISRPSGIYTDPTRLTTFSTVIVDRISSLPGVLNAALSTGVPFATDPYKSTFEIRNRPLGADAPQPFANITYVTPGYFDTMKIRLLKGRLFTINDMHVGNVLGVGTVRVIDEALAKRFWPDRNPIGAEMGNENRWAQIVGVVESVHDTDLSADSKGMIYIPGFAGTTLSVRTSENPRSIVSAVREQVAAVDADVPLYDLSTMNNLVATSLARRRFSATLLGLFAALALVLSVVGVYGVIAYLVMQRTREIGVRMALGAQPRNILRLVLQEGLVMVLSGVVLGLVGFLLVRPLITSQLFGVRSTDLLTIVSVSLFLIGVATLAASVPARRAMRVDPMIAIRYE